jgi:hypothetical protein
MLFVELWNVAEGRGDYASQSSLGGYTADLAVDGDTNPDAGGGYCAWPAWLDGISGEVYAWWMVDLGSQYAIHSVIIYSERGSYSQCK